MPLKDVWNVPPVRPNKLAKRLSADVGYLKTQRRKLNGKEWKFVQELVSGDGQVTLKEAAMRAGYKEVSAKVMAWKLTNPEISPHVVAAIQEYRAELAAKYGTTYERHMKDLQMIRDAALAAGAYGAAVQAEYRRGQALGTIYVERKEIRHGTIDSMSKEEVMRKLEEIKRLYGPPAEILDMDLSAAVKTVEKDPPFEGRKAWEAIPNVPAHPEVIDIEHDETRSGLVQEGEGESAELPHYEDREPGQSRDS
jgi:phage terminase small subunit